MRVTLLPLGNWGDVCTRWPIVIGPSKDAWQYQNDNSDSCKLHTTDCYIRSLSDEMTCSSTHISDKQAFRLMSFAKLPNVQSHKSMGKGNSDRLINSSRLLFLQPLFVIVNLQSNDQHQMTLPIRIWWLASCHDVNACGSIQLLHNYTNTGIS